MTEYTNMGTQITGSGRKRIPNRERLTAEDDALSQIAREVSFGICLFFLILGGNARHTAPNVFHGVPSI